MKQLIIAAAFIVSTLIAGAQPPMGSKAPEISLPSATGELMNLSSLKGKVVLIDFWASWCMPCRQSIRQLLPIYNKYHGKGFEVYGVSIDANAKAWEKAVAYDNAKWLQVIDLHATGGNELTQTWNLRFIPSTFLLDKEGNIVAKGARPHELEKWLKKLL